ncbi:MAG: amidohydrolase, partial [Burkholderiales bacterium]|nr:amidohydrolase [Burkholderiales bacterium]
MHPTRLLARLALALCAAGSLVACSSDAGPDLIFHGGPVLTVNATDEVAEALAVRDGVIVAVGRAADIL